MDTSNVHLTAFEQTIADSLGIFEEDIQFIPYEQFLKTYVDKDIAQIYYREFQQYQLDLFGQIRDQIQVAVMNGLTPNQTHLQTKL